MNSLQKIGSWILGGVVALAFLGRQKITFGIKGVYLNGLITANLIPLRLVVWIKNSTIGSILIRNMSGVLISNGKTVASISQVINKRIRSNSYVEQDVLLDLQNQELLQSLISNVQSGNINNLSFELIGEVVVGEQYPVGVKFNRVFTWQDIQQMI